MNLYPSFDPPAIVQETDDTIIDTISPKYDEKNQRVVINGIGQAVIGNEKDAYRFWVMKCLLTERYKYPAYSSDFGVEIEKIMSSDYPRSVKESEIERTIVEALSVDPRTVSVYVTSFEWNGDEVFITIEVQSVFDTEIYELNKGGETVGSIRIRVT